MRNKHTGYRGDMGNKGTREYRKLRGLREFGESSTFSRHISPKLIAFNIRELDDAAKGLTNVSADSSVWQLRLAGVAVAKPILREPEMVGLAAAVVRAKKQPLEQPSSTATPSQATFMITSKSKSDNVVRLIAKEAVSSLKGQRVKRGDQDVANLTWLLRLILIKLLPRPSTERPIKITYNSFPLPALSGRAAINIAIIFPGFLDSTQALELETLCRGMNATSASWASTSEETIITIQISFQT